MGIGSYIAAFDAGIGQVPEAVIEVQGGPVVKKIFDPPASLQNKFERGGDFLGSLKKVTPGHPYPGEQKRRPGSVGIEKLVFQLRGHHTDHEGRRLIHDLTIPLRVYDGDSRTRNPDQQPR